MSTGTKPTATPFYRPELDGLRFVAFLFVFARHTTSMRASDYARSRVLTALAPLIATCSAAGKYGVDLFFVLSAYLITELLLREKEQTGRLNVRFFLMRRVLRIWPLYFFFLAVTYAAQFVFPEYPFPRSHLVAFALLVGNWVYALRPVAASIGSQLWSVSIEEQFYLLWPFAVRRISRRAVGAAAVALLLLALASRLMFFALGYRSREIYWYSTLGQLDPIACGMLLTVFLGGRSLRLCAAARAALAVGGLGVWLATAYFLEPASDAAGAVLTNAFVSLGAVTMLVGTIGSRGPLSWKPVTYLGRISYGLYVYHLGAVVLALKTFGGRVPRQPLTFACYLTVALSATIALSFASYRFLEHPFLRLKEKYVIVKSRSAL